MSVIKHTKAKQVFSILSSLIIVVLSSRAMSPQIIMIRDCYFGAEIPSLASILDPIFSCIVCIYAIVAAILMGINSENT